MGRPIARSTSRETTIDPVLKTFADALHERYAANVYAFGSRVRGDADADSDYDVIVVSPRFADVAPLRRVPDRYQLWIAADGWGKGLDLHCFTPEEFRSQLLSDLRVWRPPAPRADPCRLVREQNRLGIKVVAIEARRVRAKF